MLFHPSYILFLQLLSRGCADVPTLLEEVTRAWEAATAVEATCVTAMFAAKTFARVDAAVCDTAALRVKDAEDRVALAEFETLGRVSRAEVENAAALAFACEDAKGFDRKITRLEDELAIEH
jgi:hypothetical protein